MTPRYRHALIVGGTGMLREASVWLARQAEAVTSLARTSASLEALDTVMKDTGTGHRPVAVDYRNRRAFESALDEALRVQGPPDVVLAWIHGLGPAFSLAERLSREAGSFDFYHVLGSGMSNPAKSREDVWRRFEGIPGLSYHRVMLGFVIETAGSRWLTNDEISGGVIRALETRAPVTTIGVVRPWSARPPRR